MMTNPVDTRQKERPEKVKVLVNLDDEALLMADAMTQIRDAESRSSYVRQLIKADYRRWQRKMERLQAQS